MSVRTVYWREIGFAGHTGIYAAGLTLDRRSDGTISRKLSRHNTARNSYKTVKRGVGIQTSAGSYKPPVGFLKAGVIVIIPFGNCAP